VKLAHLERFNQARRAVAELYRKRLAGKDLVLPAEHGRGAHVYHQFTIRSGKRDALRETLARESIAASVFYPIPLHRQPAYEAANRGLSLPVSERISAEVLSLPINPLLEEFSVDRICRALAG